MNYAGVVRVTNCLRICAIVLGVLAVLIIGARVYLATAKIEVMDEGHTTINTSTGPVEVDEGNAPNSVGKNVAKNVTRNVIRRHPETMGYYHNQPTALNIAIPFVVGGLLVGWIIATILGGPLARENEGHLELAWTKPVSRARYALGAMTVDAVGILAAVVLGTIFTLLIIYLFAAPRWDVTSQTVPALLICALSPLAWYAMCSALTSSLKRGWRFLPGLAWPVALIIPLLTTIGTDPDSNPLFKGIHVIATAINYFNPLLYSLISTTNGVLHMNAPLGTPILSAVALLVLIVLYIGASLLQWRRVEA